MACPLLHGSEEMLRLFTRNMCHPSQEEEDDQPGNTHPPTENPPSVTNVIDTAGRGHANRDVADHLPFKARPVSDRLEASQSLCVRFPT